MKYGSRSSWGLILGVWALGFYIPHPEALRTRVAPGRQILHSELTYLAYLSRLTLMQ